MARRGAADRLAPGVAGASTATITMGPRVALAPSETGVTMATRAAKGSEERSEPVARPEGRAPVEKEGVEAIPVTGVKEPGEMRAHRALAR